MPGAAAEFAALFKPSNLRSALRGDVAFALAIMAMLALLVMPAPRFLLDILLAASITLSVAVLMTALFTRKALEFSTFPSILLIATIFRLGLNIASTRLILTDGHQGPDAAGSVIESFGNFVMQGNIVIGVVVFAILVLVNFVVITRGSGRIAEVAARFSLDAMPGKQMAIDADLSSGLINEHEARARRKKLEEESNFYGSMDGASKYVRGDAIAGLLITLINIIGGILVGVFQNALTFGEAVETYTLLTVGDGLVSQVPALIISVAAGLLVSKAGVEGSAERALSDQFSEYPKALAVVAGILLLFAILPGMPFFPFFLLASLMGAAAWSVHRKKTDLAAQGRKKDTQAARARVEDDPAQMLAMDDLKIEVGYGLLPLIADGTGVKLTDQIKAVRRAIAQEIGFVTPPVRILDNLQLGAEDYVIRLKEQEVARGSVRPGRYLVMDPKGRRLDLVGEVTTEPAFGLEAMWIDESQRQTASLRGLTVVDAATVLTTHLTEIIRAEAPTLLSYAETRKLLDGLGDRHRQLVADLIPAQASVSTLQRVLQALIAERISIRDLPAILEALAEVAGGASLAQMIEHVRARLARQICGAIKGADGSASILTLSAEWERAFSESIAGEPNDRQLAMAPSRLQDFATALLRRLEDAAAQGHAAALVTSAQVRPFVRSVVERVRPQTMVLSQNEIHPQIRLRNLGAV